MIRHDTDGHLKIIADNPGNAADIIFYSNSTTERMRIGSDGQVHIGTTGNYGTIGSAAAFQIYGNNAGGNVSQNIINHASAIASSTASSMMSSLC